MDINRSKLAIVSLFMITIFSWFLPLSIYAASRGISVISDLSHQSGKLGEYRALIIGINDYKDRKIPDLETAVNDARAMAKLFRERYGFRVKLLLDRKATRKGIYQALRNLASSTKPDDSVLIYYAGHGDLDRLTNDGWWIPADAKGGDPVTYLNNFQVQTYIRSMKARHVLLVSDSCYSGTLFGQARAIPQVIDDKYYLNLYNEKSRWGMTSGNKTPVSDYGTGGHSVFAYQLLKELRNTEKPYISTQELYTRIAPIISNNSEQTPLCRPIRNTGDQGGEFVFVASSSAIVEKPSPRSSKAYLSVKSNVSAARVLVDGRYIGKTNLSDVEITSGEHRIRVEKVGYEPYVWKMRFEKGRRRDLYVILDPKAPSKGRLYVNTQPYNARVRILNIAPKFYQGIGLDAGRYHVEVSANGYEMQKMWVSLAAGQEKTLDIRLQPISTLDSSVTKSKVIKRDGRFVGYANGVVYDKYTELEWLAGPDRNTNWFEAKLWVKSLSVAGGGWRMPTIKELKTLHKKGSGKRNMTLLLKFTGRFVWSGEFRDSSSAWCFNYISGKLDWHHFNATFDFSSKRGFAVRSRR